MQKLCCFPLSDPPTVTVNLKCASACCASKMTLPKTHSPTLSKRKDSVDCDTQNTSCCCKTKKRVLSQSARGKETEREEATTNG